jgi:hypothetical protein
MPLLSEVVREDLLSLTSPAFVSKWFLERVPAIFDENASSHASWRRALANELDVSPFGVLVVGSASVGISINPRKSLAPFSLESDVDVAVVSSFHFDEAWRWLRRLGSKRYALPAHAQRWVREHEERLVYWGMVATDQLLPHMPYGAVWMPRLAAMEAKEPVAGRAITIRLYRDFDSLEGALQHSARRMKEALERMGDVK